MNKLTRRALGVAGFALMVTTSASFAQEPPPVRVRGEITKVDGTTSGASRRATAKSDGEARRAAADCRDGEGLARRHQGRHIRRRIGDAAGRRQPEGLRDPHLPGLAEGRGRRPVPAVGSPARQHHDQRVRGATTVAGKDGRELLVKYKDGEKKVIVPPEHADHRQVRAGQRGRSQGRRQGVRCRDQQTDGSLTAGGVMSAATSRSAV